MIKKGWVKNAAISMIYDLLYPSQRTSGGNIFLKSTARLYSFDVPCWYPFEEHHHGSLKSTMVEELNQIMQSVFLIIIIKNENLFCNSLDSLAEKPCVN